MRVQIHALPPEPLVQLSGPTHVELRRRAGRMEVVPAKPGHPCAVSLRDAGIGERVVAVNYEDLAQNTPYRQSHAAYVRKGAARYHPARTRCPKCWRRG